MTNIIIKKTKNKGRGVFAQRDFKKGEVIEICHVFEVPHKAVENVNNLQDYFFDWDEENKIYASLSGCGLFYNHSYEPNANYEEDIKNKIMKFIAVKDIKKGEEILINYNGEIKNKDPMWFDLK